MFPYVRLKVMEIQRHSADVDGTRMEYLRAGSGPPLLLIHGLIGGNFCWRFNIPEFSRRYTTFAVDLPGFGECDAPSELDCGMNAQAIRLLQWLEQSQMESVDVLGASWGGGVAALLAGMSPRVRSLVLAAPVNPWSKNGEGRVRFFSRRPGATLLRLGMPFSRPVHRVAVQRMYGDRSRVSAGTVEGYSRRVLRRGRVLNILNTLRNWDKDLSVLEKSFKSVKAPTLLVWGTRDTAVDIRSSQVLMQKLPRCELAAIEGAGHLPFEETPEEFNQLVLDFLERTPARTQTI